jgi:hypothetical protein
MRFTFVCRSATRLPKVIVTAEITDTSRGQLIVWISVTLAAGLVPTARVE